MPPVEYVAQAALDALRSAGLTVGRQPGDCATLRYGESQNGYAIEQVYGDLRPWDVARLGAFRHPESVLLLAGHVPRALGAHLRERGIHYADAGGNLWYRSPSALLWVEGRPRADLARPMPMPPLLAAAIQALFVILRDPHTLALSLSEHAERAGVSHMAVQNAVRFAEDRGWIRTLGGAQRDLVYAPCLLNAWLEGFAAHLDPYTVITRATPVGAPDVRAWAAAVDASDAWGPDLAGGELGATRAGCELLSPYGSIWVAAWDADTMGRLGLAPSPEGPLVVRRAFTHGLSDDGATHVDPLLLLGELYNLPDARLDGTRATLRARVEARWAR